MAALDFITVDSRLVDPMTVNPNMDNELSTIEDFLEFSTAELKYFLLNKGESIAGCRAELAERAILAQQRASSSGPSEPKKFKIEREDSKGEYANVLEEYSLTDPDVANEWSVDISGIPSLDIGKIFHYILTKEAFDTYYLSEYKAKKAYQFLEAVCVRSIQVHVVTNFVFVKGTIAPLNQTGDGFDANKSPNIVKILTTADNDIVVSCCSCTSDLYQCCNHVIAVLFRVERLAREMEARDSAGKEPDSPPEHQDVSKPVKISDLFKKKDPYAQMLLERIHRPSAEEKRRFMEKICQTIPNCLFAQMFKGSIGVTQGVDQAAQGTTPAAEPSQAQATTSRVTRAAQVTMPAQKTIAAQSRAAAQPVPRAIPIALTAVNNTKTAIVIPVSTVIGTARVTQPTPTTLSSQTATTHAPTK
ncbi:uncharacterized protein LOC110987979 isoform X2 [Acanthaster planci]|nr:uncharacterized protein LOC110987979 isoform X2 [Acanthaster planci]XP_022106874.1 uncharacterized protein LOC110987979 isoform X2 [Acanthaster planci]XP_022106875.1 uncharacterized protein LOC110987979 isoform X2 [Acanthaster planci]XP_022106876.1 uncharacterized protein LOC110987979 isoform X2 [Acanthaster planci]XP_022106877.1 uncharacterized protein LOC110987979 isoform X2 [Acanthaster planci]XP_022106878.1 uncharacterized protein LOC110987979 isoform X2 [Acanthaster planci]